MNLPTIALMIATAAPPADGPPDLPDSAAEAQLVPDAPALWPVAPAVDPFRPPSSAACPEADPTEPWEARQARAQAAIARADALFREKKYGEALTQLDQAACAFPHRDYDFMRASVHEQRGDCVTAIAAYERFLDQDPPVEDARVARDRIRACREPSAAALPVPAPRLHASSPSPRRVPSRPPRLSPSTGPGTSPAASCSAWASWVLVWGPGCSSRRAKTTPCPRRTTTTCSTRIGSSGCAPRAGP